MTTTFQDIDVCEATSRAAHRSEHGQRIVVGVDGSAAALAALRWAHSHAQQLGATVQAVSIYAPTSVMAFGVFAYPAVPPIDPDKVRRAAAAELEHSIAASFGRDAPQVARLVVQDNSPGRALLRVARDASMLVVGATHRHGLGVLLGSTAAACIRDATIPVVVVPDQAAPHG